MTVEKKEVLRFTVNERIQHFALMICVLILMITGLSLRFADTEFGRVVIELEGGMASRGLWHRIASVGLMALWFYHALYVTFTDRGHAQLMAIRPAVRDFRNAVIILKNRFGLTNQEAKFDRFDCRQKFQYWAVALGVISMTTVNRHALCWPACRMIVVYASTPTKRTARSRRTSCCVAWITRERLFWNW